MATTAKPTPNQKLRYERERRCWSQQELADMIGTTPLNVGRWERGVTLPGPHFRQKLCEVFEKTAQELDLIPVQADSHQPEEAPASVRTPLALTPPEVSLSLWNVPYHRNLFFTGREDILTYLHTVLTSEEQPVALTQPQAISGLGGIGKTQTAVEYAHRYRDEHNVVVWARADSHDLLVSDYLTIASLLNLLERNEQDQSKIVHAVLRWFDTHKSWLLILDNADNLEIVNDFLPSAGTGHVLLTTRAYSTGTVAQRIELEKMGRDEGMLFLLRRIKRLKGNASLDTVPEAIRTQAQAIVGALDGLPLALDQAGAYIEETGCTLIDYLKFYKTRRNRLLRTRGRDATGHPEPVVTTWSLSFEKVEQINPAAAELLHLCAFLHPDFIPEVMIIEGASQLGPILQPVVEDELELNEAIGELRKYSLVKRDPEAKILNLHRLVQVVIKDAMDKETEHAWVERVVHLLNRAFPEVVFEHWSRCQEYLPHAQLCAELVAESGVILPEAAKLLNRVGNYLQVRAQYREAETLLQQSLTLHRQLLGPEHPAVATSLNDLALLYRIQGKYRQAKPLYQQALLIREQQLGPDHLEVAQTLNNLAKLYNDEGNYEQAESLFLRTLTIYEQMLGPHHLDVASTLDNLAWLYYDQGKYEQAEPLYLRAIAINEQALGPNHPDLAQTLSNLGVLYWKEAKYKQAELLYQRALAIYKHALGPDHPYVADILNNLGVLYHTQGKYEQAEPLLQRGITIYEQRIGSYHPELANMINELGIVYRDQGKYEQAEPLFLRSRAIREQMLRPNHPELSKSLAHLATLYRLQERYSEAEPLYQRALVICEQEPGQKHPHTAGILNRLAKLYAVQSKYEQAEPLFQRALAIYEQIEWKHPDVATALENYALLLHETERETEAAAMEARAQAIRVKQEQ